MLPFIDDVRKIDIRTFCFDVSPQEVRYFSNTISSMYGIVSPYIYNCNYIIS